TRVVAAFLDVDGLKATNDMYGHPAGDELLRQLAALLRARLRGQDLIFRYGGDEFVCLFVDADLEGAQRLTHELNHEFRSRHRHSLSIGLAQLRMDDTARTLLARADAALYAQRKSPATRRQHLPPLDRQPRPQGETLPNQRDEPSSSPARRARAHDHRRRPDRPRAATHHRSGCEQSGWTRSAGPLSFRNGCRTRAAAGRGRRCRSGDGARTNGLRDGDPTTP